MKGTSAMKELKYVWIKKLEVYFEFYQTFVMEFLAKIDNCLRF